MMEIIAHIAGVLLGISFLLGGLFCFILLFKLIFRKPAGGDMHFDITVKTGPKKETE